MLNMHDFISSFLTHKEYIALLCFILADYLSGCGAALKEHRLSSAINFKGIVIKLITLVIPLVMYPVFYVYNMDYIVSGFVWAFIIANGLSLIENLKILGIPLPDYIVKLFENAPNKNDKAPNIPENQISQSNINKEEKIDNKE